MASGALLALVTHQGMQDSQMACLKRSDKVSGVTVVCSGRLCYMIMYMFACKYIVHVRVYEVRGL